MKTALTIVAVWVGFNILFVVWRLWVTRDRKPSTRDGYGVYHVAGWERDRGCAGGTMNEYPTYGLIAWYRAEDAVVDRQGAVVGIPNRTPWMIRTFWHRLPMWARRVVWWTVKRQGLINRRLPHGT